MFGYVIANFDALSEADKNRYRAYYCGLCHSLGEKHGEFGRISLTYDMAFLVLFLSATYQISPAAKTERCLLHPLKEHEYIRNEFSDYAADMNIALCYFNFVDNWNDDKNIVSLYEAKLFKAKYAKVEKSYPRQCAVIQDCLSSLSQAEKDGVMNPDIPASCFGRLMGELFAVKEDALSEKLRSFGDSLGRFIYILDACVDFTKDIKKTRYNPLVSTDSHNFRDILNMLMSDCTENFLALPMLQEDTLIKNILYSGIWAKYEVAMKKENKKNDI